AGRLAGGRQRSRRMGGRASRREKRRQIRALGARRDPRTLVRRADRRPRLFLMKLFLMNRLRTPRGANLLLSLAIGGVTLGVWWLLARPREAPPWPHAISGFAFSPLEADGDPERAAYPSAEAIDADLALVAHRARSIRTYSLAGALAD